MLVFPNAKINLGLHITAKRADGYHEIDSCMYPIPWQDALEAVPASKFTFSSSGLDIPGKLEDNLCFKAFQILEKEAGAQAIHLHLHKIIPMGGGLGGGSADAAFTLTLTNRLQQLGLSTQDLEKYAAQLGSDCAFFIQNKPALASGRGEILSPISLNLSGKHIVLVYPDTFVSTKEAYQGCVPQPRTESVGEILEKYPLEKWAEHLGNDFEKWIFPKYPVLKETKDKLYEIGAVYASMTGSGATLFGIFDSSIKIEAIKKAFPPGFLIHTGTLA